MLYQSVATTRIMLVHPKLLRWLKTDNLTKSSHHCDLLCVRSRFRPTPYQLFMPSQVFIGMIVSKMTPRCHRIMALCGKRPALMKKSENQAVINDFALDESSQHDMKELNCIVVKWLKFFRRIFHKCKLFYVITCTVMVHKVLTAMVSFAL